MKQNENGYCAVAECPGLGSHFQQVLLCFQNSMNNVSSSDMSPGDGELKICSPCSLDSSTDSFIFGDETLPQKS